MSVESERGPVIAANKMLPFVNPPKPSGMIGAGVCTLE
jgi:hypothetical protein